VERPGLAAAAGKINLQKNFSAKKGFSPGGQEDIEMIP
jgi:hypothetical protein